VGKTHFYPQGLKMGFESIESYEAMQNFGGGYVNDYHAWLAEMTGGRVREYDHGLQSNSWCSRPSHLPEELHNNTWMVTRSLEFLRRRDADRPFFLFASFHRPHPPIDPPMSFWEMYRDRPVPAPHVGDWAAEHDVPVVGVNAWHGRLPAEVLARSRRAYYAQIGHIDNQIGRLLNYMRREIHAGPTWVIFASDHGEMLGDHHLFRKVYAYQGSAGVPLIITPPEGPISGEHHGRPADFLRRTPVTLTDLYPTILEAAGLAVPARTEGRSLLPLLAGEDRLEGREYVHGEHSDCFGRTQDMQYLTDGRWKYIWFPVTGREQLFDLGADPGEAADLSADPNCREQLELWRSRMVAELAPREADGLSDGKRLIAGKGLPAVRPELLED
jgi:arylsulfatase A-like enzyme